MVDITPPVPSEQKLIQSYGAGGFRIAEERFHRPVLVTAGAVFDWPVGAFSELELESFAALRGVTPGLELLLLGCGERMQAIPAEVRQGLRDWGIVVELMNTGAACRTYNVLLAEQRRIAAALIPVD